MNVEIIAEAIYKKRRSHNVDAVSFSELYPSAQTPYLEEATEVLKLLLPEAQALDLLKAEILKFGSQRKWCKEHLISNQYVSDILTGKVGIGKSVQAALGIKRVIMYEKVENGK